MVLPIYLNVFKVKPDAIERRLRLYFIPKPSTHIVNVLRRNSLKCAIQCNDYREEGLDAGVYVLPPDEGKQKIEMILHGVVNAGEISEIGLDPENYIVKYFVFNTIVEKLKNMEDVWMCIKASTLTFAKKSPEQRIDIGSKLFSSYRSYELRVEKILGHLYIILDYRLKIFPPDVIWVLNNLKEHSILKDVFIKCMVDENQSSTKQLRGIVKEVKRKGDSYTVEVHGDLVQHRGGIRTATVVVGIRKEVDATKCMFANNPRYYRRLVEAFGEDYHEINRLIRRNSSLDPKKRFEYIVSGAELLYRLVFPLEIGGIKYYMSKEPYVIEQGGYL